MIDLMNESNIKSPAYQGIHCEFQNLWNKLFLNKHRIDEVSLSRAGPIWPLAKGALQHEYFRMAWFTFSPTRAILTADLLLRSNQLWASRLWEYPWAILHTNLQPESKVLDIGSGHSLFPLYLAGKSNYVDSIDTDRYTMQRISPTLAQICGVKVNYAVGDALDLAKPDNAYDYVFCISMLEHLEEERHNRAYVNYHRQKLDRKAIRECLRVIKPGGRVILTLDYAPPDISQRAFHLDYVKDLLKEFDAYLLLPVSDWGSIDFSNGKREELKRLWVEFFPYEPRYPAGAALGIILTKP